MALRNTDRPRPATLSENEQKWVTRHSNGKRRLIGRHNEPMKRKSKSVLFFQPLWLPPSHFLSKWSYFPM